MIVAREAVQRDVPAAAALLRSCPEAGQWSEQDLLRSFEPGAARRCLVAEREGELIGMLLAECPVPEEAEILTIAVAPHCRRQGVASALLRRFMNHRHGRVLLEVRASNAAARRLYHSLGFITVRVRSHYYSSPREDAEIMQVVLP